MTSALQRKCPNQVAELVISLNSFEPSSRDYLDRDDEDLKIYQRTIEARKITEEALTALMRNAGIVV